MKTWLYIALALLLAGAVGYGFGRYATPAKIEVRTETKVQTQVEYRDRIVEKTVEGPVRTVTHTVLRMVPCTDGASTPAQVTDTVVEQGPTVITTDTVKNDTVTQVAQSETKTVTKMEQPKLMLQVGGISGLDFKPTWNAGASYRFAGPIWAGLSYHSDKKLELRVALTF
jgi:hypothetical protein